MKRDVEERENMFMEALTYSESEKPNQPLGRKRPISTAIGKRPKKNIIDHAEESDEDQGAVQKYKLYTQRSEKGLKNNENNNIDQNEMDELDDVIGIMNDKKVNTKNKSNHSSGQKNKYQNDKFDKYNLEKETKPAEEQKEYDYLDFEQNLK